MSQSPAYLQSKVISIDGPSANTFIDLSESTYGLPELISLYGIFGVTKGDYSGNSVSLYQEFYDGGSGDAIVVFDAMSSTLGSVVDSLIPYSSFMEEDSCIRVSKGLNVFFRSSSTVTYSSFTVFYK
tara:strand:+ start:220 stop:600 length:381 start_codon:yes stop_codon:yes gene_type:complete